MKTCSRPVLGFLLSSLTGAVAAILTAIVPADLGAQAAAALVIDGGTLIDGNGGTPVTDTVVVIQGDRISSVSRRGQATIPANAQVIRADGKFILPGLWDSQVSYQWYYGEVMLNYGITSTIDVGIAGEIGAAHRDAVHKGYIRGPRPFTGISRFTNEPVGGTGLETPGTPGRTPKTAQEAREYVRVWTELGADMIQIAEGGLPMEIFVEAGIIPMQIIQGATKWSAEMINRGRDLGTVEVGKLADIVIVNADPLQSIENLRQVDTVIFNGRRVALGYSAGYNPVYNRDSEMNPPVDALLWVNAFRNVAFNGSGGRFNGRRPVAAGQPLPDPVESPQPAIESISPLTVTEGSASTTVTLKGFNFVRRTQVLFKGVPVPYKAVSGSELQVVIDGSLLREPGWHEIAVRIPWPLHPEIGLQWGNGTSNKAHLIVKFRD